MCVYAHFAHTNTSTPELRQSRCLWSERVYHHHISRCCLEELSIDLFTHSRRFARFEDENEDADMPDDDDFLMWSRRIETDEPAEAKSIESLYVQAGVFTQAEIDMGRNDEEYDELFRSVMLFSEPFRTLVTLLEGLHSSSIYSSKGSVYRIRFVAPGTPHGGPSMPSAAASAPETTSAAYPLWAMIVSLSTKNMNVYDEDSNITSGVNPDVEFKGLLQAEADALDSVTTSDSSSVTDTEWLNASASVKGTVIHSCGSLWENHGTKWSNSWSDDTHSETKMYLQQNIVNDCDEMNDSELMQKREQISSYVGMYDS